MGTVVDCRCGADSNRFDLEIAGHLQMHPKHIRCFQVRVRCMCPLVSTRLIWVACCTLNRRLVKLVGSLSVCIICSIGVVFAIIGVTLTFGNLDNPRKWLVRFPFDDP